MPKRKGDKGTESDSLQKRPPVNCILHVSGIEHPDYTPLSKVRGSATDKLAQLHDIRDKRHIEPHDSPYRIEAATKTLLKINIV